MRYDTVTLVTDLGHGDEAVGLVHSILRCEAPHARVVDLCHEIEPGDVAAAGLLLARSVDSLAPGVVLVSLGDRLDRAPAVISVGAGQSLLVGPDNGVLAAPAAAVGGADAAVLLPLPDRPPADDLPVAADADGANSTGVVPSPSGVRAVHPARDVLAPAAAALANGVAMRCLGAEVDPGRLRPGLLSLPRPAPDGTVVAQTLAVTRWGAVQLNVDREAVAVLGDLLTVEWDGPEHVHSVRLARPGEPGTAGALCLRDDVHGLLELSVAGGSAAHLGLAPHTEVRLRAAR